MLKKNLNYILNIYIYFFMYNFIEITINFIIKINIQYI